jgi:hypothetical protein
MSGMNRLTTVTENAAMITVPTTTGEITMMVVATGPQPVERSSARIAAAGAAMTRAPAPMTSTARAGR